MAIAVSELTSNGSTSNTTDYNPASISPAANRLILCAVHSTRGSSTDPVVPTMSGNGLTWVEVGNILTQNSGTLRGRFTLFRAMGASPSSGQPTISHSAAGTGCKWSITEWSGVDTSGTNGSGALAQAAVFNRADASATVTMTLGSAVTAGNATYGAGGFLGTMTWEEEAGWTKLPATEITIATPDAKLGGAYLLNSSDQSFTITAGSSTEPGGVIVEIKAAGATAYELNAGPGSYAITGSPATPISARQVAANAGSYAVTGAQAGAIADRIVSAMPGAYVITGADADLVYSTGAQEYELALDPGSYAITGSNATPVAARIVAALAGSYAITGSAAGLLAARLLVASPGAYALTGAPAGTVAGRTISVDPGSYQTNGAPAGVSAARLLVAVPGSYEVSGSPAQLLSSDSATPVASPRTGTTLTGGRTAPGLGSGRTSAGITTGRTEGA